MALTRQEHASIILRLMRKGCIGCGRCSSFCMQEYVFTLLRWTFTGFFYSLYRNMADGRRLNVALTRQQDTSIILCDTPAIDNAKSKLQRNVHTTEEAPPS